MSSFLVHCARLYIWISDFWGKRRRQLPLALLACVATPAFAVTEVPETVRLSEIDSGLLVFKTTETGEYIPAPTVHTTVEMEVSGLVARVEVSQRFYNPTDEWLEGVYVFPLPEDSAVDRMRMMVGDRYIEGMIKEKQEAKQIYEQAKAEGKKAALVEQERPNLFTNSVANIGSSEDVIVQIEY